MDQTRMIGLSDVYSSLNPILDLGYVYWQQPMANTFVTKVFFMKKKRVDGLDALNSMPPVTRVQSKKQALPGVMRIVPEGSLGAW